MGFLSGPMALATSRTFVKSDLFSVLVKTAKIRNANTKMTTPMKSLTGLLRGITDTEKKVSNPAPAEERVIFVDERQSGETPKCFLMNRKLRKKLGRLKVVEATIKPMTPNWDIKTNPNGKPTITLRSVSLRL